MLLQRDLILVYNCAIDVWDTLTLTSPKLEDLVPWKGSHPTLSRRLRSTGGRWTGLRRGRFSNSGLCVTVIVELIVLPR